MKSISVIMPIYNVKPYLSESINSVLNQSFSDFELILVDDGSFDGSEEICNEYKENDRRVIVVHKENGGLSSARNEGIKISSGRYIFFIDSDDTIPVNSLELLYNEIIKTKSDLCIGNFFRGNRKEVKNLPNECMTNYEAIENMYNFNGCFIVAWNKLYKREIFNNVKYPFGKIHEDDFIAHEIIYRASRISFVNDPIYNYRVTKGSITNSSLKIGHLDSIEAFIQRVIFCKLHNCKYTQKITEYKLWEEINKKYYCFYDDFTAKKRIIELKKMFNQVIFEMLNNDIFTIREKIGILFFYLNPKLYKILFLEGN